MAEKIEEVSVEPEVPPSKGKKKPHTEIPRESASDLRTLLLILALAVIVFFMLLYKRSHPEEYAQSLVQVKENADAAYSKAEEVLPVAYRGAGGFFEYVFDYGKASDLLPELPKVRISPDSVVTEIEAAGSSGSVSSGSVLPDDAVSLTGGLKSASWTETVPVPLVVEFSGYRIEFDHPPVETVTVSAGGAKMTVGPAIRVKEARNVSE